jgi:hypothetical protein
MAVDPVDGSANVIFYDRRGDPQNRKQTVTLARSTNGGDSFQNYAWTTEPFEAGGVFFGDYSGIAAYGGRVYGVWTEKPVSVPEKISEGKTLTNKPPTEKNSPDKPAADKTAKPEPVPPKPRGGTVVKVGVADFNPSTH